MPENVKELIEEIKDLSSLMLNLAYSSVLFESKAIAKEVVSSFDRLEELEENLYEHLFAASRGLPIKKLISVTDIVDSAKMVALAAKNLSEMVMNGKELHPIVKEALRSTDETIARALVKGKSICKDKSLGELKLRTDAGINIIAIKRENKWIFNPKKGTNILENDILIGVGSSSSCEKLQKLAKGVIKKI